MKEVDKYINSIYKNMDQSCEDVKQLKLEMKLHITKTIEELISEGKSESESIKLALNKFGDATEIEAELLEAVNIRKRKFKIILYISIICSLILVSFVFNSIKNYNMLKGSIVFALSPLYVVFKYRTLDNSRKKGIQINKFYEFLKVSFALYIAFLISNMFFPMYTYPYFDSNLLFAVKLKPLETIIGEINRLSYVKVPLISLLTNWLKMILYFMPLGFFIPIIFKSKKYYKCFISGLFTIILIYLLRLIFHFIGVYAGNLIISTDYIIFNTIGLLIGFLIYTLCKKNISIKLKSVH